MKTLAPKTKAGLTAGLAVGVCLLIGTLIGALRRPAAADLAQRASSYFSDDSGARGAYLLLQETLPSVEVLRRPVSAFDDPHGNFSTLIALAPVQPLTPSEAGALDSWLQSGGQLILASESGWDIRSGRSRAFAVGAAKKDRSKDGKDDGKDNGEDNGAVEPTHEAPLPHENEFLARHGWKSEAGTHKAGSGQVVFFPEKLAFSNGTLRQNADNAVALTEICAAWGNGKVAFDEYHQGFGDKRTFREVLGLFFVTPWGLATLQAIVAGAVFMVGTKRRFGRPLDPVVQERLSPLDIVDARGELFRTARARLLAVQLIHQHLSSHIAALLGRAQDLLNPEARARLAGSDGEQEAALALYATLVEAANTRQDLSDAGLIRIGELAGQIQRRMNDAVGGAVRTRRITG